MVNVSCNGEPSQLSGYTSPGWKARMFRASTNFFGKIKTI